MKEETKMRLGGIFDRRDELQNRMREAQQLRVDQEAEFLRRFDVLATTVIAPAFEEIGKLIESRGQEYFVERRKESVQHDGRITDAAVTLRFPMSDGRTTRSFNEGPHLSVVCNKFKKCVWIHQNTISPGRGGSGGSIGDFKLEELTTEFLHEKVADLLQKVFV